MASALIQLARLLPMIETDDLTPWEKDFVESIGDRVAEDEGQTTCLSTKQLECINKIYIKHFAD